MFNQLITFASIFVVSLTAFIFIIKKYGDSANIWAGVFFGVFFLTMLTSGVATLISVVNVFMCKEYLPARVESYELISLENTLEQNGRISGGGSFLGSSFSGQIGSSTVCTFAIKNENGEISILNIPANKIKFFQTEDNFVQVQQHFHIFKYPYGLTAKRRTNGWWYEEDNTWKIYLPKESFNQYIKFN